MPTSPHTLVCLSQLIEQPMPKNEDQYRQEDERVRKNLPSGVKLVRTLRGHADTVGRIRWSPDGRILASPSADKTIRLWDITTGECLQTLDGHKSGVWNCVFDPTGETLISSRSDKMVKVWHVERGQLLHTLKAHEQQICALAIDSTGRVIASGSDDQTIKLWNAASSPCEGGGKRCSLTY